MSYFRKGSKQPKTKAKKEKANNSKKLVPTQPLTVSRMSATPLLDHVKAEIEHSLKIGDVSLSFFLIIRSPYHLDTTCVTDVLVPRKGCDLGVMNIGEMSFA